jgi:hypothetical protein
MPGLAYYAPLAQRGRTAITETQTRNTAGYPVNVCIHPTPMSKETQVSPGTSHSPWSAEVSSSDAVSNSEEELDG